MGNMEQTIRERAKLRIANIFNVSVEMLQNNSRFGDELKASFVSDFKHNEYDQIDQDIRDVADKNITKELNSGMLIINTVGDYCNHMARCYENCPNIVSKILEIKI